jgi:Glycosyltransferase family 87
VRSSARAPDDIPFLVWALMWLLGSVVALVSLGVDILHPGVNRMIGRDFTNVWTAGHLVWAGQVRCIFDVSCFRDAIHQSLGVVTSQNYSYPPPALFLAAVFGLVPYYIALAAWTIGGIGFFIWCARPYLPKEFPPYLVALTPAATINLCNGHYGFLLGGLWLLCFRTLDRKPEISGVFAGLLTIKPHLGVMVVATMLRNRRALTAALVMTSTLVILSIAAFGLGAWNSFLLNTTSEQKLILTSANPTLYFRMMPSAFVAFGKGAAGVAAQVLIGTLAIIMLVRNRRWDAFSAATATFLLVPYVFNYDMTVACLGFAIVLKERWGSLSRFERLVFILAFLSPELTYLAAFIVPLTLLAALYVQLRDGTDGRPYCAVAPEPELQASPTVRV